MPMIGKIAGTAIVLPDNVRSGMIVPVACRGSFDRTEFKEHCFENLDRTFRMGIARGDILVAGRNFAKGETGEETVIALQGLGISAVVAVSVNKIFLRNAINLGLPVIILPVAKEIVSHGDLIEVDPTDALIRNLTTGMAAVGKQLPSMFLKILEAGGIVNYIVSSEDKKR